MQIVINASGPPISQELLKRIARASVPTFGHYVEDGAMDPGIVPIVQPAKFVGRAVTVKTVAPDSALVHKAVSYLTEGDVLVIQTDDLRHAPVGEVVGLAAKTRKAAAIVIDGPSTDCAELRRLGMPVFSRGTSCLTTKILGIDGGGINTTITCGGVVVNPGDIVVGDDNGVLVLSTQVAENLVDMALKDDHEEIAFRDEISSGASLPELSGVDAMFKERFGM